MIARPARDARVRRRGITIIEMMVMMTGLAAMLGMIASLLQLLMRMDADGRARLDGTVAVSRLAERFRRDVHDASAAAVPKPATPGENARLRIELGPDHSVDYEAAEEGKVMRIERKGAVVRREVYGLPSRSPARLALRGDSPRRFAVVSLDRRTVGLSSDPPRDFEVVALVGKDSDRLRPADAPQGGGGAR